MQPWALPTFLSYLLVHWGRLSSTVWAHLQGPYSWTIMDRVKFKLPLPPLILISLQVGVMAKYKLTRKKGELSSTFGILCYSILEH